MRLRITKNATAALDGFPTSKKKPERRSLTQRLLVALFIIPVGVTFIALGGWAFYLLITAVLVIAGWEFWWMFTRGGYIPARQVLMFGTAALALTRSAWGFLYQDMVLSALVIIALTVHTFRYERGSEQPGTNFGLTTGGLLYLGWLGSYIISIRQLPMGEWWAMIIFPAMGVADAAAYFVGTRFGRHPISQRISPNKTWEGYAGSILFGTLSGLLFASLWHVREPAILPIYGLILGAVVSILAPFSDLAKSMFKRQLQLKDTGTIFPGHGGMMDRIDTWIYSAVLSYYLITWLWL